MLDLETLRLIWWLLIGFLFIGFAITDGYDLGVAALYPLIAKNDTERSIVLNTLRPFWEGNQVWIILGAGAIFAAWPFVYAVAFSGAYFAVLLLLLTMGISRPVSFKYRSKSSNILWRRTWDWCVFIGGIIPAIIFGILIGNILIGLPFSFDTELRITYTGTLLELFNPFALWCGLTSLFMLTLHGTLYLAIKTENPIYKRAISAARISAIFLIVFFAIGGIWIAYDVAGFQVISNVDHYGFSNPLQKQVTVQTGAWLQNYTLYRASVIAPALGFLGAILAFLTAGLGTGRVAFVCSSLSIIGIISTVGVSMFPFILPSQTNYTSSLLIWDASSTELTLLVMLFGMIIFIPIILLYTAWVFHALRGKVKASAIEAEKKQHVY